MGFLLVLGGIFTFTNHPYAKNSNSPSEEVKIIEELKNKAYGQYTIGTFIIGSNEIDVEIVGSQEYYNSIKIEVEQLVKDTIKSTSFENYSIKVSHSNTDQLLSKKDRENLSYLKEIFASINGNLVKSYPKQIEGVNIKDSASSGLSFKIRTSLDKNDESIVKEMEEKISKLIETELSSNKLIKEKSRIIYIYNKTGEKIN